ncbi:hypothetical protein V8F06_006122 [Rhypophila decipiens]
MTETELGEWRAGMSVATAMDVQWATYDGKFLEANQELGRERAVSCGDVLHSLGVQDVILHNATNDAFLELFGFLRLLQATAEELESRRHGGPPTTDFDLEQTTRNGYYLKENQALDRKALKSYYRQRQFQKSQNNKENQKDKENQKGKDNQKYRRSYKEEGSTSTPSPEPKQTVAVIGRTDNTSWRRY